VYASQPFNGNLPCGSGAPPRPASHLAAWVLSNRIVILPFEIKQYNPNPYPNLNCRPAVESARQRLPVAAESWMVVFPEAVIQKFHARAIVSLSS